MSLLLECVCILCVFVCILCGLYGLCSVRRKFRIQAFYFAFRIRMMAIAAATMRILVHVSRMA